MSHSRAASAAFFTLSTLVVIGSATALAALWPLARAGAKAEAASLIGEAGSGNSAEAAADYHLATWLDPSNPAGYIGLARTQILAGQADAALVTLDRAGEGSEAANLRLRTLIELGRTSEAAGRAATLAVPGRSDADLLLAGLTYALAGRTADIPALIPLVASPQTAQRISRAASGNLALASELFASGLPESSRALLIAQPTSFERNFLLGQILYARHMPDDLKTATDYLESAVTLNPSDVPARRLLASVYSDRGLTAQSTAQTSLANKLESGRP